MNRVTKWVADLLDAGVWRGAAASGDKYEDWPAKLAPRRLAARPPAPACPPRSSTPSAPPPPPKPRKCA